MRGQPLTLHIIIGYVGHKNRPQGSHGWENLDKLILF
jgi:hypothetical protein